MAICGIKLIDLTYDAIAIFGYTFFLHSKIVNRTKYLPLATSFPEQLVGGIKITHVKKVGHNSEFLFGIYWWTWKATIY